MALDLIYIDLYRQYFYVHIYFPLKIKKQCNRIEYQEQKTESSVFQICTAKKTMVWQFTIKLKLRTSVTIFHTYFL